MIMSHTTYHLYELCWLEGLRAHLKGEDESANPHVPDTREHDYWTDGWWETCLNEGDILSHFAE